MTWATAFADIGGHDLGCRGAGKVAPITTVFLETIEK